MFFAHMKKRNMQPLEFQMLNLQIAFINIFHLQNIFILYRYNYIDYL